MDAPTLHAFLRRLEQDRVLGLDLRATLAVEALLEQMAADAEIGEPWSYDSQCAAIASVLARDQSEWQAIHARLKVFFTAPEGYLGREEPVREVEAKPAGPRARPSIVLVPSTALASRRPRLVARVRAGAADSLRRLHRLPRPVWGWSMAVVSAAAAVVLVVGAVVAVRWLAARIEPLPAAIESGVLRSQDEALARAPHPSVVHQPVLRDSKKSEPRAEPSQRSEPAPQPAAETVTPAPREGARVESVREDMSSGGSAGVEEDVREDMSSEGASGAEDDVPEPDEEHVREDISPSAESSAAAALDDVLRGEPEARPGARYATGVALWLVSLLFAAVGIRWLGAGRRQVVARDEQRRRALDLRRQQAGDDDAQALPYAVERVAPLPLAAIDDAATILGRVAELTRGEELDVDATLDATSRRAGQFTPVLTPGRQQHHITVLVDVETGSHPYFHAVLFVLARWHRLGVKIERHDFKHRPRFVEARPVDADVDALRAEIAPRLELGALARRSDGSPLLIVTRMTDLAEKTGAMPWLRHLGAWPARAVLDLDPRPLAERDGEARRVGNRLRDAGVARFPFTAEGLRAMAMHMTYQTGLPAPESSLRSWPEVLTHLRRWAALAASVPDPTWAQLDAFRRSFEDLRLALPDPRYVQRLLDWLRSEKENPISADGRRLAISPGLVRALLDELRAAEGLAPGQLSTAERRARELVMQQIAAATPTSGAMSDRCAMRFAFHRAVLEPTRAHDLLPFFSNAEAPELKALLEAHLGRLPAPVDEWQAVQENMVEGADGPVLLTHLLGRPWWVRRDVPLLLTVAGLAGAAWATLLLELEARAAAAGVVGAFGLGLTAIVHRRARRRALLAALMTEEAEAAPRPGWFSISVVPLFVAVALAYGVTSLFAPDPVKTTPDSAVDEVDLPARLDRIAMLVDEGEFRQALTQLDRRATEFAADPDLAILASELRERAELDLRLAAASKAVESGDNNLALRIYAVVRDLDPANTEAKAGISALAPTLDPSRRFSFVRIETTPPSRALVDERIFDTPVELPLNVGLHEIVVVAPGYEAMRKTIAVQERDMALWYDLHPLVVTQEKAAKTPTGTQKTPSTEIDFGLLPPAGPAKKQDAGAVTDASSTTGDGETGVDAVKKSARGSQDEPIVQPVQPDRDDADFLAGRAKYREGNYVGAVALFQRAYAAKARAELLSSIGRAYERAGYPSLAVHYYEKFITEASADPAFGEADIQRVRVVLGIARAAAKEKLERKSQTSE
ncbi:PEGA domain-containing protein [Nannocystis radixulma]|uniref:PEGA domain-containing protein n=1 Tax=Nannocystis radixulma TaxID=2995305 RepID=A0ABT5B9W9_9BACT|nr:PEGA domain-containing protein [Nannocystis radixulma]MDC0669801.1 PEGA domain-containing protein [Nannocystis radixulma]